MATLIRKHIHGSEWVAVIMYKVPVNEVTVLPSARLCCPWYGLMRRGWVKPAFHSTDFHRKVRYEAQWVRVKGGNVYFPVRITDTVHLHTGHWSPSVHELLIHLENKGFHGAPRFLGIDDLGREVLAFIPGEVPGNDYPELRPYMWSDATLVGLARLLRSYHDATIGFAPMATGGWQLTYADNSKHEVICHNDAAPYNVVFQNQSPVALIDFDMAGPGPRMWDIAYSLYTCVPLGSFVPATSAGTTEPYRSDLHADERFRRIRLLMESYGYPVANDLQTWVIERLVALCDTLKTGAAQGNPAFQSMIDEGHLSYYENEIRFVTDHFEEWK